MGFSYYTNTRMSNEFRQILSGRSHSFHLTGKKFHKRSDPFANYLQNVPRGPTGSSITGDPEQITPEDISECYTLNLRLVCDYSQSVQWVDILNDLRVEFSTHIETVTDDDYHYKHHTFTNLGYHIVTEELKKEGRPIDNKTLMEKFNYYKSKDGDEIVTSIVMAENYGDDGDSCDDDYSYGEEDQTSPEEEPIRTYINVNPIEDEEGYDPVDNVYVKNVYVNEMFRVAVYTYSIPSVYQVIISFVVTSQFALNELTHKLCNTSINNSLSSDNVTSIQDYHRQQVNECKQRATGINNRMIIDIDDFTNSFDSIDYTQIMIDKIHNNYSTILEF